MHTSCCAAIPINPQTRHIYPQMSPAYPKKRFTDLQKSPIYQHMSYIDQKKIHIYMFTRKRDLSLYICMHTFNCAAMPIYSQTNPVYTQRETRKRALYIDKRAPYMLMKEPFKYLCISPAVQPCLYTRKQALYKHKRSLCIHQRALYTHKRAIHIFMHTSCCASMPSIPANRYYKHAKESTPAKEPYVTSKDMYIHAKEPCVSAKELFISANEPYVSATYARSIFAMCVCVCV